MSRVGNWCYRWTCTWKCCKLELKEKLLIWFWGCRYYCSLLPLHMLKIFHLSVHFCFFHLYGHSAVLHIGTFLISLKYFTLIWDYINSLSCKFVQTRLSAKCVLSLSTSKKSVDFYSPLNCTVHSICPWKWLYLFKVAVWLGMSRLQSAPSVSLNLGLVTEMHMINKQNSV